MKYEFKIRVKEYPLASFKDYMRGYCKPEYFDQTKKKFEKKLREMIKSREYCDVWLLINSLTDDGDFIEVIQ